MKSNLQFDTLKLDKSHIYSNDKFFTKSCKRLSSNSYQSNIIDDSIVSADKDKMYMNKAKHYFELSLSKLKENTVKFSASKFRSYYLDSRDGEPTHWRGHSR